MVLHVQWLVCISSTLQTYEINRSYRWCKYTDETVEAIKKISVEIGKTPVQVNEAAGFVVNRILIPMINEAAFIKMEGVSDIAGIDAAMKLGQTIQWDH